MVELSRVIDAHTHVLDSVILRDYLRKAPLFGGPIITLHNWVQVEGPPRYTLDEVLHLAAMHPRLKVVGSVNVYQCSPSYLKKLDGHLARKELVGLKMYPGYQHFEMDSCPLVDQVAELCALHKVPLIFHTGDCSSGRGAVSKFAHPLGLEALAMRHPQTTFVMAHLGFPWLLEGAMVVNGQPNVFADLSGMLDKTLPPKAKQKRQAMIDQVAADLRRAVNHYPELVNKLMFVTDYAGEHSHLVEVAGYWQVVNRVFDHDDRCKVLYGTAEQVFGLAR